MYETLARLRDSDIKSDGKCSWWIQRGPNGHVWINESRLKRDHAEMFPEKFPTRGEFEELSDRVEELEDRVDLSESRRREETSRDGRSQTPIVGGRTLRAVTTVTEDE